MKQFTARHPWAILAAGAAIQILTGLPAAWGVFQQPVMDEFSLTEDGAGYAFGILIAAFGVGCVIGGFCRIKRPALRGAVGHRPALRRVLCGGLLPGRRGYGFGQCSAFRRGWARRFSTRPSSPVPRNGTPGARALPRGHWRRGGPERCVPDRIRPHGAEGLWPGAGIRGAFWALGALTLSVCLVGSALLTDPPPAKQKPEEQGRGKGTPALDLAPLQMLRTKQYWLCAGAVCCSTPAVLLFSPIILKLGMERGLDETAALWSIVLGSGGQRCGTDADAMLSDHIGRRAPTLGCLRLRLGCRRRSGRRRGWWVVVCYAGLTFCYSALAAVLPALSTDLFGLPHAGVNYGFIALGMSGGSILSYIGAQALPLAARHWLAGICAAAGLICVSLVKPVENG